MFGGTSSSQQNSANGISELLLGGAGGFATSSSLGNGFGNAAVTTDAASTSGSATMAPGGTASGTTTASSGNNTNTAFDLNDFPSLGGTAVGSNSNSNSTNVTSNGLSAALRDQQRLLAHHNQQLLQQQTGGSNPQQQQQASSQQQKQQQQEQNNLYRLAMQGGSNGGNFNMATEDFPALPGAPPPSNNSSNVSVGAGGAGDVGASGSSSLLIGGGNTGVINSSQGGAGLGGVGSNVDPSRVAVAVDIYGGGNDPDSSAPLASLDGSGLLGGGVGGPGLRVSLPQQQHNSSNQRTKTDTAPTGTALSGDYGLLGLLGVIRMTDADRNALALGSDLTMLGLKNLGSSEHIYNTFSGPWSESSGNTKEPHYQVRARFHFCFLLSLESGHTLSLLKKVEFAKTTSNVFFFIMPSNFCFRRSMLDC